MKQKAAFQGQKLLQILVVFLVGLTLLVTTACSTGNVQGARPYNPPVQAGGANNPYAGQGDSYTTYNQSPDPKVNQN